MRRKNRSKIDFEILFKIKYIHKQKTLNIFVILMQQSDKEFIYVVKKWNE